MRLSDWLKYVEQVEKEQGSQAAEQQDANDQRQDAGAAEEGRDTKSGAVVEPPARKDSPSAPSIRAAKDTKPPVSDPVQGKLIDDDVEIPDIEDFLPIFEKPREETRRSDAGRPAETGKDAGSGKEADGGTKPVEPARAVTPPAAFRPPVEKKPESKVSEPARPEPEKPAAAKPEAAKPEAKNGSQQRPPGAAQREQTDSERRQTIRLVSPDATESRGNGKPQPAAPARPEAKAVDAGKDAPAQAAAPEQKAEAAPAEPVTPPQAPEAQAPSAPAPEARQKAPDVRDSSAQAPPAQKVQEAPVRPEAAQKSEPPRQSEAQAPEAAPQTPDEDASDYGDAGLAEILDITRLPKHIQALASTLESEEVAQNSYKRGFRESRSQLLARLLDPPISLEDAARILNVCPTTVRRYTNRGVLPHFRTAGNQRRFRLSDVIAFMESQGNRPKRGRKAGMQRQDGAEYGE